LHRCFRWQNHWMLWHMWFPRTCPFAMPIS
jgi:hypothetical protein